MLGATKACLLFAPVFGNVGGLRCENQGRCRQIGKHSYKVANLRIGLCTGRKSGRTMSSKHLNNSFNRSKQAKGCQKQKPPKLRLGGCFTREPKLTQSSLKTICSVRCPFIHSARSCVRPRLHSSVHAAKRFNEVTRPISGASSRVALPIDQLEIGLNPAHA